MHQLVCKGPTTVFPPAQPDTFPEAFRKALAHPIHCGNLICHGGHLNCHGGNLNYHGGISSLPTQPPDTHP